MGDLEYWPSKAIIEIRFCGTYVVLPGCRIIGICGTYVEQPAMEGLKEKGEGGLKYPK